MNARVNWEAVGDVLDEGGEVVGSVQGGGLAAAVRIPVPGTNGLAIELTPRGRVPRTGTTSTLFIQDTAGRRMLRLDYGYNAATNRTDFHWNQRGTFDVFGRANHAPAGRGASALYNGARYFRYAGRTLICVGLAFDAYSVVASDRPYRQLAIVTGGWAGAWAGCRVLGAVGAGLGTMVEPGGGTAVGGIAGCFIGGVSGYWAGKTLVAAAVDEFDERILRNVEEIPASRAATGAGPASSGSPGTVPTRETGMQSIGILP